MQRPSSHLRLLVILLLLVVPSRLVHASMSGTLEMHERGQVQIEQVAAEPSPLEAGDKFAQDIAEVAADADEAMRDRLHHGNELGAATLPLALWFIASQHVTGVTTPPPQR